jgi:hypothetical protein
MTVLQGINLVRLTPIPILKTGKNFHARFFFSKQALSNFGIGILFPYKCLFRRSEESFGIDRISILPFTFHANTIVIRIQEKYEKIPNK